jgi:hypothetical protein
MPRATVSKKNYQFDLTTVPGGKIEVRRMTYGEKLLRQDELMEFETDKEGNMKMSMAARKAALWDISNLVVSHNLTDESDRPLNFKNMADVNQLDALVGEEIGKFIDEVNSFENSESVAKSEGTNS